MNLDFFEKLGDALQKTIEKQQEKNKIENIKTPGINKEEIELAQKLDAVQEFTLDRYEGNMAVLENRETGEIKNIEKNQIPNNVKEGDILKCINGKYFLDKEQTTKVEKEIENKYKNLWE